MIQSIIYTFTIEIIIFLVKYLSDPLVLHKSVIKKNSTAQDLCYIYDICAQEHYEELAFVLVLSDGDCANEFAQAAVLSH